ncbi:hypothetical protein RUND412_004105 [Rhizina undulata]
MLSMDSDRSTGAKAGTDFGWVLTRKGGAYRGTEDPGRGAVEDVDSCIGIGCWCRCGRGCRASSESTRRSQVLQHDLAVIASTETGEETAKTSVFEDCGKTPV